MSISFLVTIGLDVYKLRMVGLKTETTFMLYYICVQEDGTTSQFKCDTISENSPYLSAMVFKKLQHAFVMSIII